MPPQIALVLCILFVMFVFAIDFNRKSKISRGLWIPLIWILLVGSRSIFEWLNWSIPDDIHEGNPIDRAVNAILIGAGLFILIWRRIYWLKVLSRNKWIFLFFLYGGISLFWSDFPDIAFKRWVRALGNIVMIMVVLSDPEPVDALKTLIKRFAYLLIPFSVLFVKYYRDIGVKYNDWTGEIEYLGVTTSKNMLGVLLLVCGIFFFWNFLNAVRCKDGSNKGEIIIQGLFLIMISWLLVRSDCATATACLIIAIIIYIGTGFSWMRGNPRYVGKYLLFGIMFFIALFYGLGLDELIFSSLGRNATLTGRTELWEDILEIQTNPFIGAGFESFWLGDRLSVIWAKQWWHPNQAHNGYLEIYLNLGWMGVILLVGILFSSYCNIRRILLSDYEYGRLAITIFILALMYNLTESAFKGSLMWFMFLFVTLDCRGISEVRNLGENWIQRRGEI